MIMGLTVQSHPFPFSKSYSHSHPIQIFQIIFLVSTMVKSGIPFPHTLVSVVYDRTHKS